MKIRGNTQIMAGTITNAEISSSAAIATTKLADGAFLIKSNGSVVFTANQSLGGFKITNLADPTAAQDAVTRAWALAQFSPAFIADAPLSVVSGHLLIDLSGYQVLLGYIPENVANKGAASGYASLNSSTKIPIAQIPTGTTSTTIPFGNDSRFSDARTPLTHASTHAVAGSDPVTLAQSQITSLVSDLSGKQPLDTDLTQIAVLATTSFGRDFLTLVDAAAGRTKLALGSSATHPTTDYEPALGNPSIDGYVLSSTAAGVRSWIAMSGGGGGAVTSVFGRTGVVVAASNDYTFAQIASTPTTISGYGITDFNSLGDARWSLLGHTHTFASLTSKPTTLSGYGITDAQPLDVDLTAVAALTTDSFGLQLLTKTSAANARSYIGAGTSSFDGVFSSLTGTPTTLSGYGITNAVPNTRTVNGHALSSDVVVTPTDLGLVIGTNVQAWNTNLDAWAALATITKAASGINGHPVSVEASYGPRAGDVTELPNTTDGLSQSFQSGSGGYLYAVRWILSKTGSPTGNAYAKLYAGANITGTYGSDMRPGGSPAVADVVSDPLDVTTLTGSPLSTEFKFSGANRLLLASITNYVISIEFGPPQVGTSINVGRSSVFGGGGSVYSGNPAHHNVGAGGWNGSVDFDYAFEVVTTTALRDTDITSIVLDQTGLAIKGRNSNALTIVPNELLSGPRTFYIVTGDATRTLTLTADATIGGTNTGDQTIALTGNVTGSGTGSFAATLVTIPTGVAMSGSLLATAIVAPGTPAAGKASLYVDSTSKALASKDDAGVVRHNIQTKATVANNFLTGVDDAGLFSAAQPAFSNISGSATAGQLPALDAITAPANDVSMNTHKITNVVDPTSAQDAATRAYVLANGSGFSRSIAIEYPTATENVPICFTSNAMTISKVRAVLVGSSSPSVTYNVKYGTDVTSLTSVTTSPSALTNTTTGVDATLNNVSVPANGWLVLTTSAQSGTVNWLVVTIEF